MLLSGLQLQPLITPSLYPHLDLVKLYLYLYIPTWDGF